MELKGERRIPAAVDTTWAALNDPAILKACITGCESLERSGQDAFTAVVAVKIGPVSARFKGQLRMTDVRAPHGYTIHFDGQGGVAGFGKGSAEVSLSPDAAGTRLGYMARASVGGKLAQLGSRLIDAAATKMAEDFFQAFESQLSPPAQPVAVAVPVHSPTSQAARRWWWLGAALALVVLYLLIRA
jgi:carbon monoxide dehydrogenase subunit G